MINFNLEELNISGPIVIGVSTGADSMALFHYLINNYNDKIICAHINHNVRKQSKEEEEYLRNYCKNNNITFECFKIQKYTENNFENEARKKRYNFYEEIINKYNSKYLFLAHHADDLIETILMKIIRGSNIKGYAGIKKIAKKNNFYIVRPLLDYTKEEIYNYIKNNNITYYEDYTNSDTNYTRNRFRKKIIPLLKKEDKDIHKKFIRFSNTLLEYNDYIDYETKKIVNKIYKCNKLDINEFNNIHNFMKKSVLYYILNELYNNKENIVKESHINNILKIINSNTPNQEIHLPQNIEMIKEYNYLYLKDKNINKDSYKVKFKDKFENDNFIIEKINETDKDGNDICRLNTKEIVLPLYIKNKDDGDIIEVLGLNGKKKVKEIFIEKKMPKAKRKIYPLLVDNNDNIIWIPNIKKSKFNKKKNEKYDIILKYIEKEKNK